MVIRVIKRCSPNLSLLVSNKKKRNMKKIYVKPTAQAIKVQTQQMIALSTGDEYTPTDVTYSREEEFEW